MTSVPPYQFDLGVTGQKEDKEEGEEKEEMKEKEEVEKEEEKE